ncbi:cellulase family glycosylhydrolase [Actinocrinis sp.]|uniref:cellulase family glycosylhydrolase n=1 Tax=Actinocrinis sp. TaxID=1920516 RepID=UPI002D25B8D7|nr:cellulase family glycosylhydrolase [Actinocrinis sp.]HZP54152.1 cellulase family glycosylhydrolase [Actinocrinis sp.]
MFRFIARRKLVSGLCAATALAGSALFVVQAQPASAATNQFKGVNWADTRDNYNSGWVIPDGLAASDSYSQVYSIADSYIKAFQANLGANTVRLPINPPSVSQSWWGAYRGAIDAALADGMKVIISAWTQSTSTGTITDMTAWTNMWSTVVGQYGGNGNVYFEPLNEPYGYSLSQWVSICSSWLSQFSSVPRGRVIISGTGYNDHVTGVGASSALTGTLLSLHYYGTWNNYTQESQWESDLNNRIGSYTSRTIIDEFGAPMTTGVNYLANHNGAVEQSYFAAVTDLSRADGMGNVYWAGLKTGDTYSMEYHNGSGLSNNNASGVTQVRWGWGY